MITVDNLSKSFTLHILNEKKIVACRDISFHVPPGGFLGLSGPSGVGKSTVLKCLYRTYLASSGAIRYNSVVYGRVDLATLPDRAVIDIRYKEMGYVSQFLKVIPRVSALAVIMNAPIIEMPQEAGCTGAGGPAGSDPSAPIPPHDRISSPWYADRAG